MVHEPYHVFDILLSSVLRRPTGHVAGIQCPGYSSEEQDVDVKYVAQLRN